MQPVPPFDGTHSSRKLLVFKQPPLPAPVSRQPPATVWQVRETQV